MNYEEARNAYDQASRNVISLREQLRASDEMLAKLKAIGRMSEDVAVGSNAQARDALLLEWLETNEQYQAELEQSRDLGMAVAYAEIDAELARLDMRYAIALVGRDDA